MANDRYDLIVIGGGPAGYTGAIRAAQLGLKTACVEKESELGGTCLRVGCIPSKALLESSELYAMARESLGVHGIGVKNVELDLDAMQKRKRKIVGTHTKGVAYLFKKNKVDRLTGTARLTGEGKIEVEGKEGARSLEADRILIATGSRPATLPGVEFDGDRIGSSTEALAYGEVPKKLIVIGAGYIGLEMGSVWQRLGSKVTVLEYLDRILPGMDDEIAKEAHRIFKKQGLEFHLGVKVTGAKATKRGAKVETESGETFEADRVLVAVGRAPNTEGLGLEDAGVETDKRGRIIVDDKFQTSLEGVHAVGDVIEGPMLAHKASEEAVACVEYLATGYGHVNYEAIPGVVYTHPEIATIGWSEEALKEHGREFNKGKFPFTANGRAQSLAQTEGRVKILADKETDRILGVHIIGPRAGELIAEAAVAIECGASSEDLARTVHAHPTLSEAVKESALSVLGRAINI